MPKHSQHDEWQGSLFADSPTLPTPPQHAESGGPEDLPARIAAVDTHHSVLVQAPAGAGKTGLLTERFLALLAEVDEPEQILAITFTRAATAEMRSRVIEALEHAADSEAPGEAAPPVEHFAWRALQQSNANNWRLLEQPHRLDIQTIDSLCLRIAHGQPLLARLGGQLAPTESATEMYAAAARRTLMHLGSERDPELHASLLHLLMLQDNNLQSCERMIAGMLGRRDAWLHSLPVGQPTEDDWQRIRSEWERPFANENTRVLRELRQHFSSDPILTGEILDLARYAASNPEAKDLSLLDNLRELPGHEPAHAEHWRCLATLLLTSKNEWRKAWDKRSGFPTDARGAEGDRQKSMKLRMKDCASFFKESEAGPQILALFCQLSTLPRARYSDEQWATLRSVVRVLRHATAELRVVFAEADSVDFVEIAHAAELVLDDPAGMRGLLESERKQHLLVDEFQDTSRRQHALLAKLLREWQPGDGRTVFLVGDPLQSIYAFRQAEVALFHETREHGLLYCDERLRHPCSPLQLTHNFRTDRELVHALNERLPHIFTTGRDQFQPAHATRSDAESGLHVHTFWTTPDEEDSKQRARQDEAQRIVSILRDELPRIANSHAAGENEYKVAVLVRARTHLAAILPALRDAGIPYRAVDLEGLDSRQEVLDLHALLCALLHPADRVAWLSVLRAPWCGLTLADLHTLAGSDDPSELRRSIPEQIERRANLLSPEGQKQLARVWSILSDARAARFRENNQLSLAAWLERTWMTLGGPACLDQASRENAESFLALLDKLQPSGLEVLRGDFASQLARLCAAPDPQVNERFGIQLMTIHKSKGLGFHSVIVPALERKGNISGKDLIVMLERSSTERAGESEFLVAPAGSVEEEEDPTYAWIRREKRQRDSEELRRLFYVACTRARKRLHLLFTLEEKEGAAEPTPSWPDSLLAAAWPALREDALAQRETALITAPVTLDSTAASPEAAVPRPLHLDRLPTEFQPLVQSEDIALLRRQAPQVVHEIRANTNDFTYRREATGSPAARARGVALHALFETITAHASHAGQAPENISQLAEQLYAQARRILRERAVPLEETDALAPELAKIALCALATPIGEWIFAPHPQAAAESAWQAFDAEGRLRTLRVDRSFLAGEKPGESGEDFLWIVDYKTVTEQDLPPTPEALQEWRDTQRSKWTDQLESYRSALLTHSHHAESTGIRYALYYPTLNELLVWDEQHRWVQG